MSRDEQALHVIILEDDILLSRKAYRDWRQVADDYPDCVASFGPWPVSGIIDLIKAEWPELLSEEEIARFVRSAKETLTLREQRRK